MQRDTCSEHAQTASGRCTKVRANARQQRHHPSSAEKLAWSKPFRCTTNPSVIRHLLETSRRLLHPRKAANPDV